jgi:hypothetical protein
MLSSFYTHIALFISCVIFLFSFVSFIIRIQTHSDLFQSTQTLIIPNHQESQTTQITNLTNTPDVQTDDIFLREKILGLNRTNQTVFDRFIFINSPKVTCNYVEDTQHFMVIIILSRALNFDYRQVIRATWGRNGKYKLSNIYVQTVFFVGTDDSVQSAIRNEQAIFNDVIEIGN